MPISDLIALGLIWMRTNQNRHLLPMIAIGLNRNAAICVIVDSMRSGMKKASTDSGRVRQRFALPQAAARCCSAIRARLHPFRKCRQGARIAPSALALAELGRSGRRMRGEHGCFGAIARFSLRAEFSRGRRELLLRAIIAPPPALRIKPSISPLTMIHRLDCSVIGPRVNCLPFDLVKRLLRQTAASDNRRAFTIGWVRTRDPKIDRMNPTICGLRTVTWLVARNEISHPVVIRRCLRHRDDFKQISGHV